LIADHQRPTPTSHNTKKFIRSSCLRRPAEFAGWNGYRAHRARAQLPVVAEIPLRRVKERFYRPTSFTALQGADLRIHDFSAFVSRRRSVQVPHHNPSACARDPEPE
jgi:hypothetical protein